MEDADTRNSGDAELECVERARNGDRAAFEMLMNRYRKDIYNLARRMTGSHHDADDVAQETFIKAYSSIKRFRGASTFKTWLYSIAINTARTSSAREARLRRVEFPLMEGVANGACSEPGLVRHESIKEIVVKSIKRLPERQKEVLILKLFHGMKHSEIARALGISVGAAKANLFHAMKFLKTRLEVEQGR